MTTDIYDAETINDTIRCQITVPYSRFQNSLSVARPVNTVALHLPWWLLMSCWSRQWAYPFGYQFSKNNIYYDAKQTSQKHMKASYNMVPSANLGTWKCSSIFRWEPVEYPQIYSWTQKYWNKTSWMSQITDLRTKWRLGMWSFSGAETPSRLKGLTVCAGSGY
jgi:hypothetical protein